MFNDLFKTISLDKDYEAVLSMQHHIPDVVIKHIRWMCWITPTNSCGHLRGLFIVGLAGQQLAEGLSCFLAFETTNCKVNH